MNDYRNPNEAIAYLKSIQKLAEKIRGYSTVSIETSAPRGSRTTVINLENLDKLAPHSADSTVSRKPNFNLRVSPIVHSSDSIRLPNLPSIKSGTSQGLERSSKEYLHLQALYRDLTAKSVEWNLLWSNNPHMAKLNAEMEVTRESIKSALSSIRRRGIAETKKYCPPRILTRIEQIHSYIEQLPTRRLSRNMQMHFPMPANLDLIHYKFSWRLTQLRGNTKTIPQYIIVVTYEVDYSSSTATGHLTTMQEPDPQADIGASFKTPEGAIDLLNTYLDLDRIDTDLNVLPFPDYGINSETINMDKVSDVDLDTDLDRLIVRTTEFLSDDDQEDLLMKILRHIPDHLKSSQLRIDIRTEAFARIKPVTDRTARSDLTTSLLTDFDNVTLRNVGANANKGEVYIRTLSVAQAQSNLNLLKRRLLKLGYPVKDSGVRNVFTFAVGAGKRSDVRALRKFIQSISSELTAEQVLKVRRSLGV